MKKILSALLAAAMLITVICVVTLPVSAAKGDWSVYAGKTQYLEDYTGTMADIAGYKYDSQEGLVVVPAPWESSTPYVTVQTTDPVNIKEGVYMKVRIDDFTYDATDKWFGFSIWDSQNVQLGSFGEGYGLGVETLIRIKSGAGANYEGDDKTNWAGAMSMLQWYDDTDPEGQRTECPSDDPNYKASFVNEFDENNKPIYTLEIKWDDAAGECKVFINGTAASAAYNRAMNRYFKKLSYQAYIGFSMQNNVMCGTAACTLLEYGTSADDAKTPIGDDARDPQVFTNEYADITPADSVEPGRPAFTLNGSATTSQVAGKPSSVFGHKLLVNDDGSINATADSANFITFTLTVDSECSYDIKDFPIVLLITRNFCTCNYVDNDGDGTPDAICACSNEKLKTYPLAGNVIKESDQYATDTNPLTEWAPYKDGQDNDILYFIADWNPIIESMQMEGRIHGIRIDNYIMKGSNPDRNNFDLLEVAFFKTQDEAVEYFKEYLASIGGNFEDNVPPVDTEAPTDPEQPTDSEEPADSEEPTDPEEDTDNGEDPETPTQGNNNNGGDDNNSKEPEKKGCGSAIGVGALAVIALAGFGILSFRKKED